MEKRLNFLLMNNMYPISEKRGRVKKTLDIAYKLDILIHCITVYRINNLVK